MDEVFGLFPTPVLRAPGVLNAELVRGLVQHFSGQAYDPNHASQQLSHTAMLSPADSPLLVSAAEALTPKIVDMGALMFGERLAWSIKEMWVNVLDPGGLQAPHTHANSFISGVVYLTPVHEESQTMFIKASGGTEFFFRNEHAGVAPTAFNTERWRAPAPAPGDLVLFPSYLLHGVPANQGQRRITLSFNAIPQGFNAWGYAVGFN